jgi:plasmid stabilization system protein ParE
MSYAVHYSDESVSDRDELFDFISNQCGTLDTALKYIQGIEDLIGVIAMQPMRFPIRYDSFYYKYGLNVRRANYKKVAIIYCFDEEGLYVHRIMPSSLITA